MAHHTRARQETIAHFRTSGAPFCDHFDIPLQASRSIPRAKNWRVTRLDLHLRGQKRSHFSSSLAGFAFRSVGLGGRPCVISHRAAPRRIASRKVAASHCQRAGHRIAKGSGEATGVEVLSTLCKRLQ